MSGKVFDISGAIREQLPPVRLRGTDYEIAHFSIGERLRLERQYRALGDRLTKKEEAGEEITDDEWDEYMIKGVALALKGVPDEIAVTLTEKEFEGLRNIMERVRGRSIMVEETDDESAEGNA